MTAAQRIRDAALYEEDVKHWLFYKSSEELYFELFDFRNTLGSERYEATSVLTDEEARIFFLFVAEAMERENV